MSITVIRGNIFTSKCQTITNTVNCEGVMGAGIALECRLRYPDMYAKYVQLCLENRIDIGLLWIHKARDRWILNFPTKKHWKYPSRKEYLHVGLKKFLATYKNRGIESIAFPLLGSDKGGIHQDESLEIMTSYLSQANLEVEIYQYDPTANDDLFERTKEWLLAQNIDSIATATKLRRNYVAKLVEAMKDPQILQLNQLAKVEGIGIKTLENLFHFSCNSLDKVSNANIRQQSLI